MNQIGQDTISHSLKLELLKTLVGIIILVGFLGSCYQVFSTILNNL